MKNTKNTEERKEMDLGALTLNGRRTFPAAALQKFAGGGAFGGERRRGSSKGRARQKRKMVKARDGESKRWAMQSPQRFAEGNGFSGERRGSSEGSSLERLEMASESVGRTTMNHRP
jgi:hypothetical protein